MTKIKLTEDDALSIVELYTKHEEYDDMPRDYLYDFVESKQTTKDKRTLLSSLKQLSKDHINTSKDINGMIGYIKSCK